MFHKRFTIPYMTVSRPIVDQIRRAIAAERDRGTSLSEIARRAGVAPIVVSRFINGKTVTLATAEAITHALGKSLIIS
jgi:transcriptional regulator with XRE-family HTH domain